MFYTLFLCKDSVGDAIENPTIKSIPSSTTESTNYQSANAIENWANSFEDLISDPFGLHCFKVFKVCYLVQSIDGCKYWWFVLCIHVMYLTEGISRVLLKVVLFSPLFHKFSPIFPKIFSPNILLRALCINSW